MRISIIYMLMVITVNAMSQQKEIQLYDGPAPGSEKWDWSEGVNNKNRFNVMTVYNVVRPTLTVLVPDAALANGTAVIIAPGGGFHFLAIDHEGNNAAQWLVKKGITVFVLKYRLVHIFHDNPFEDMLNTKDKKAWDKESDPIIPLAIADGRQAIAYVRNHAAEYKLEKDLIGIMGFSAGGMVAAASAFRYTAQNRPDFVASVYGDMPAAIQDKMQTDTPPLFMACAQDDEFGFAAHAIRMYREWYAAKRPVEMHLLSKGGHGFGMGDEKNTTYQWLDQLIRWLRTEGLVTAK